jgi:hypothetical protein
MHARHETISQLRGCLPKGELTPPNFRYIKCTCTSYNETYTCKRTYEYAGHVRNSCKRQHDSLASSVSASLYLPPHSPPTQPKPSTTAHRLAGMNATMTNLYRTFLQRRSPDKQILPEFLPTPRAAQCWQSLAWATQNKSGDMALGTYKIWCVLAEPGTHLPQGCLNGTSNSCIHTSAST